MMPYLRMEPENLYHQILLTISSVASGYFELNIYMMALLIAIKLILLQKNFINAMKRIVTTPILMLSSPLLYTSFLFLQQVEFGHFSSLMLIIHFCKEIYLWMFICLNLLPLLIRTPLTLYANSTRSFIAPS